MADERLYAAVDDYLEALYGAADQALAAAAASAGASGLPNIAVSPVQGRLLHLLVRLTGATRVLEIGTLAGYSAIWLARALPAGGRLVSIDAEPEHLAIARANIERAGLAHAVELRAGRALEVMAALEHEGAGPFDLVFIDADKPPLADYFERSLGLSRPGTLIVVDNVVREGEVLEADHPDERVRGVRRFNEMLAASPAVTSVILQLVGRKGHDGLALALVK